MTRGSDEDNARMVERARGVADVIIRFVEH